MTIKVHHVSTYQNATAEINIFHLSFDVKRALKESSIRDGVAVVCVPGGTGAVILLENDSKIHENLKELVCSFVEDPTGDRPKRRSGSGAIESHLRAALMPSSVTIPVKNGQLLLDSWQEILVYDFDNKPGRREVFIEIMGDAGK